MATGRSRRIVNSLTETRGRNTPPPDNSRAIAFAKELEELARQRRESSKPAPGSEPERRHEEAAAVRLHHWGAGELGSLGSSTRLTAGDLARIAGRHRSNERRFYYDNRGSARVYIPQRSLDGKSDYTDIRDFRTELFLDLAKGASPTHSARILGVLDRFEAENPYYGDRYDNKGFPPMLNLVGRIAEIKTPEGLDNALGELGYAIRRGSTALNEVRFEISHDVMPFGEGSENLGDAVMWLANGSANGSPIDWVQAAFSETDETVHEIAQAVYAELMQDRGRSQAVQPPLATLVVGLFDQHSLDYWG